MVIVYNMITNDVTRITTSKESMSSKKVNHKELKLIDIYSQNSFHIHNRTS
jgi:hypothetical protein